MWRIVSLFVVVLGLHAQTVAVVPINEVGYINLTLPPSFSLISNPLENAESNSIRNLFRGLQQPVPDGLTVYVMTNGAYKSTTYSQAINDFTPADVAELELGPGTGAFVFNPSADPLVLTFVGKIRDGTTVVRVPAGLSIVADPVARGSLPLDQRGFPAEPGDIVYQWDSARQRFVISDFDGFGDGWTGWYPSAPKPDAGEAFIVYKRRAADWVVTFSANP